MTIRKAADVRIAPPLADALNGWREAQAVTVDPYVKLLDKEIEQTEGMTASALYKLAYAAGLARARDLYTNPHRSDA